MRACRRRRRRSVRALSLRRHDAVGIGETHRDGALHVLRRSRRRKVSSGNRPKAPIARSSFAFVSLRDDTAPYTESFSSSFIDSMTIVDAAGNSIGTTPARRFSCSQAGRYRSEYYTCLFRFSRSSDGVQDFEKIGTRPQDFRLLITNPAREEQAVALQCNSVNRGGEGERRRDILPNAAPSRLIVATPASNAYAFWEGDHDAAPSSRLVRIPRPGSG